MFSSGPKSRTTAAYLAIFLGWAGIHKFYLGYWNAGFVHVALNAVGLMVFSANFAAPDDDLVVYVAIAAGLIILLGYFYVRRFHLGHPTAQILNPARLLLWPWWLLRHTYRLAVVGLDIWREEAAERRWRRSWRSRRWRQYGRDDGGCSFGLVVLILGMVLSLAIAAAIVFLYFLIIFLIGFIAVAASVAIGVIEGVRYLNRGDDQLEGEYVVGQRLWF